MTLTTDHGHFANNQTTYTANTNSAGQITTTITVTGAGTTAHITAAYTPTGDCSATASATLRVVTGHEGSLRDILLPRLHGEHGTGLHGIWRDRAEDSVKQFINDMVAGGQTGSAVFRFGGLKFNGPLDSDANGTPDYLQSSELTDLARLQAPAPS